ncbi:BTB POZ fold [Fusarium beomiforme]|uniref:BTB POZ fold n=1 Tax=Fusarium beomiforme TaxID=44412 RepID=A0A9P5DYY5_9HYPO|nr:BTB POZ fold [Fusarium beomiforme]
MECISKKAVATSKPFRFLIGPDRTEYTIHSALVAHQSPVLSALVSGSFREASECSVKWDDVDEMPFPPAVAISGEEDAKPGILDQPALEEPEPEPAVEPADEPEPEPAAEPEADEPVESLRSAPSDTLYFAAIRQKRGGSQKKSLWMDFLSSWDWPPEPLDFDIMISLKDHGNPFLHHAKVYTFADRYAVTRLTDISRLKLHEALIDLVKKDGDYRNVVELVRYAFEELVPDQLRDMIVQYSACVVERLWKIEEFQELVGKHGILSKALVGKMLLRLDEKKSSGVSYTWDGEQGDAGDETITTKCNKADSKEKHLDTKDFQKRIHGDVLGQKA